MISGKGKYWVMGGAAVCAVALFLAFGRQGRTAGPQGRAAGPAPGASSAIPPQDRRSSPTSASISDAAAADAVARSTTSATGAAARSPTAGDAGQPPAGADSGKPLAYLELPLTSASALSADEQLRATDFFERQHDSWLAVRSGVARYRTKVRLIQNGQYMDTDVPAQEGRLEFVVTPVSSPEGYRSPASIQARISEDKHHWNFVRTDAFDGKAPLYQWSDDPQAPIAGREGDLAKGALHTTLFFMPLDLMAKSYPSADWNNRYMTAPDAYFAGKGLPRRRSSEQETNERFGGEPQYLFMASPALVDAFHWFSAETGELRQIDMPHAGVEQSYRYEKYVENESKTARFPTRFVQTWRKGSGAQASGWEYTIELSALQLNVPVPAERFEQP